MQCLPQGVYRPRNPQASPLYRLVEDHFDELERVWDDRYEREHGFWRPVMRRVVEQFLDCGDLRCGFARLWCSSCRKDLLLLYSCRRRCFCPSCHQKRALLFAEHVDEEVLGDLPVRQYVVTIPKMLRLCFKYDRKLLGLLSQCFYASVKELFQDAAGDRRSVPGMIASLQSYGDDPTRFYPHLHSLVTDGLVSADGSFVPVPSPDPVSLMRLFRHKLIKALLAREKISPRLVEIMQNWVHPGFSVYQGEAISPDDCEARRRLAGYMVHPPIALERLRYRAETGQVIYYGPQRSRCGDAQASPARIFPALDFLAGLCTHVPDAGQQLVRYYGAFSNARRTSPGAPASGLAPPDAVQAMNQQDSDGGEELARARYFKPYVAEGPAGQSFYAYGWAVSKSARGTSVVQHNGGNGIFVAEFLRFPDEGAMLFLTSTDTGMTATPVVGVLERILFGGAAVVPPRVVSVARDRLETLAGEWHLPQGGKLTIAADGGALEVRPEGQEAFSALAGLSPAQAARLAELCARTADIEAGAFAGDVTKLHEAMGGRNADGRDPRRGSRHDARP